MSIFDRSNGFDVQSLGFEPVDPTKIRSFRTFTVSKTISHTNGVVGLHAVTVAGWRQWQIAEVAQLFLEYLLALILCSSSDSDHVGHYRSRGGTLGQRPRHVPVHPSAELDMGHF